MKVLMGGLILCNHLEYSLPIYTMVFNVTCSHDESQVDYLGYKVLFIMNDGQTYTHTLLYIHVLIFYTQIQFMVFAILRAHQ